MNSNTCAGLITRFVTSCQQRVVVTSGNFISIPGSRFQFLSLSFILFRAVTQLF